MRHIGVSNFTEAHLQEILPHARIKPAVLQIELHPYLPQHELVDFCRANQIHVRAGKKAVRWDVGSLRPLRAVLACPAGHQVTAYSSLGSGGSPNLLADPVVTEVAAELGRSPAQVLLQWAVQRGISVIPKSVQPYARCPQVVRADEAILTLPLGGAHRCLPRCAPSRERIKANGDLNFTIPDAAMARLNGIRTRKRFVDPVEFWKIDVFGSGAKL